MNGDYEPSPEEILFTVKTPLGFSVRTTTDYWNLISTVKHPEMSDQFENVRRTLSDPDEVRASKGSSQVYLFLSKRRRKALGLRGHEAPNYSGLLGYSLPN